MDDVDTSHILIVCVVCVCVCVWCVCVCGVCVADKPTALSEISLWNKILRNQLLENKHDVKILQNDPNSPLYSVKTFEELRL